MVINLVNLHRREEKIKYKVMVSVAQWQEHWTVAPGVGGSNPLTHPV